MMRIPRLLDPFIIALIAAVAEKKKKNNHDDPLAYPRI